MLNYTRSGVFSFASVLLIYSNSGPFEACWVKFTFFFSDGHEQPYSDLNCVTCVISKEFLFYVTLSRPTDCIDIRTFDPNSDNAFLPSNYVTSSFLHSALTCIIGGVYLITLVDIRLSYWGISCGWLFIPFMFSLLFAFSSWQSHILPF
jgi:hypothetical protein